MTRRLHVWWRAAVALAATLTTPEVTPATADEPFEQEVRSSWLFGRCQDASRILTAAWRDARVSRWLRGLSAGWASLSLVDRLRLVARSIAVAGVTAVVLQAASPAGVAPFAWVLPLAFAVLGSLTSMAAEPVARAIAAKRS